MRNRAKCKLCEDIIESLHTHDYVPCKCGEIAIDGGNDYHKCVARDWDNFLRVDDEGNVIVPQIKDSQETQGNGLPEENQAAIGTPALKREDFLDMLDEVAKNIEKLPRHAMDAPITHSDFVSLILLISRVLRAD